MWTKKTILLVCDDGTEQVALFPILQSASPDGQITVVDNQVAALHRVETEKFDCVFSYSRSGPENSVNFLTEVWNRAPATGRFLVAPTIDPETQLLCAFGAHHYLSTPLNAKAVEAALDGAQARKAILPNDRVQFLISRMRSLPSRPTIYFELMRELDSANASATVIANLIKRDPGISSKLIQVVNSLFYGLAERIHDIEEAVLFLGFEVTASIVLNIEALSRFEKHQPLHDLTEQVWAHSQSLAELSRRMCQGSGQNRGACDQAYLMGLLHDIGKLVLAQNFRDEYRNITRTAEKENRPLIEVEKEVLGVSHADAGAYLLAVWGLPLMLVEAVAFHHSPCEAFTQGLSPVSLVHIAEEILESDRPLEEIMGGYPPELGLLQHTEIFSALMPERLVKNGERDTSHPSSTNAQEPDSSEPTMGHRGITPYSVQSVK